MKNVLLLTDADLRDTLADEFEGLPSRSDFVIPSGIMEWDDAGAVLYLSEGTVYVLRDNVGVMEGVAMDPRNAFNMFTNLITSSTAHEV